jgi:deoxyribodipyrimidine photo-lyase
LPKPALKDKRIHLLWFRQDLRLADNPALQAAAESGSLLPIYILDDVNAGACKMGAASRVWLQHSLSALNQSLDGKLQFFRGDARKVIAQLVDSLPVDTVFWNRCYEPWRIERDVQIKADLGALNIEVRSFNGSLLWEPWTVLKKDGTPYRVFTPYYQKGCLSQPSPRQPLPQPGKLRIHQSSVDGSLPLQALDLLPAKDWHQSLNETREIGEAAAHGKLAAFCQDALNNYRQGRDFPALDATSRLSPHLHFGELSPHQAWHRVENAAMDVGGDGPAHFLREIAWREFSYHLLYHFPALPEQNFNSRFDAFQWLEDESKLQRWQQGNTGFPIVDAGLRELWQTGYMHNRVRMIVASFLIKNMLLHWRVGAAWFWDCLFDADLASNSASWQWCAGSGADASPYFRIFNPVLQSEKFDPQGEYLIRYCPELTGLPVRYRHKPWEASPETLMAAGVRLGVDYPRPILDLKVTRERALARFRALA